MTEDRRRSPARPDLAAMHLKAVVKAERYATAKPLVVSAPVAPMTAQPNGDAALTNQLLHGEHFAAYEQTGDWAWGQLVVSGVGNADGESSGYVGYVPRACLMPAGPPPTHHITQPLTHVYPAPGLKTRPIGWMSYGALVRVEGAETGFAALSTGGFVPAPHLAPLDEPAPDWVAEAERFLGAPYLWGGRGPTGLDCSALVQLALTAAGHDCPRDSDMQEAELGRTLTPGTTPQRGDLMFWKGHVGIMLDATRLLHANGRHMAVAIETLETVARRILDMGDGPVTRHARLDAAAPDH